MKKAFPTEFVYQVFALLIAFILVHALYVTLIRPQADAFMQQEAANMKADPDYVQQRSFFVVVKDYEPRAPWVRRMLAPFLLRREVRAYRRLEGIAAVPRLLGRVDDLALVFEYREILAGPFFLDQGVIVPARMGAFAPIGISAGHIIGQHASARIGNAQRPMGKHLDLRLYPLPDLASLVEALDRGDARLALGGVVPGARSLALASLVGGGWRPRLAVVVVPHVAEVDDVGVAGPESIVVSGAEVSTVHPWLAGVASVLPAVLVARTNRV